MEKNIQTLKMELERLNNSLMVAIDEYETEYLKYRKGENNIQELSEKRNTYHFLNGKLKGLAWAIEELEKN